MKRERYMNLVVGLAEYKVLVTCPLCGRKQDAVGVVSTIESEPEICTGCGIKYRVNHPTD